MILVCVCFLFQSIYADEYFLTYYGDISWEEERANLDNLGIYLTNNLDSIGYIRFFVGKEDKLEDVKCRMKRAKNHLVNSWKISENRIVIINAGKYKKTKIILQPVIKNRPPPFRKDDN